MVSQKSVVVMNKIPLFLLIFCQYSFGGSPISVSDLIVNMDSFDGKKVFVFGYASFIFENVTIYGKNRGDRNGQYGNGIWINLDEKMSQKLGLITYRDTLSYFSKYDNECIIIEAYFHKYGEEDLWHGTFGSLDDIIKIHRCLDNTLIYKIK